MLSSQKSSWRFWSPSPVTSYVFLTTLFLRIDEWDDPKELRRARPLLLNQETVFVFVEKAAGGLLVLLTVSHWTRNERMTALLL
jgi:hypothetical protein